MKRINTSQKKNLLCHLNYIILNGQNRMFLNEEQNGSQVALVSQISHEFSNSISSITRRWIKKILYQIFFFFFFFIQNCLHFGFTIYSPYSVHEFSKSINITKILWNIIFYTYNIVRIFQKYTYLRQDLNRKLLHVSNIIESAAGRLT